MREITVKLYKFEELSEAAKKKAIEKHFDINLDYDWWDCIFYDANEVGLKLKEFGLDRNKHSKGELIDDAYTCATKITEQHGKDCDTFKIATKYIQDWNELVERYAEPNNRSKVAEGNEVAFDNEADDLEENFLSDLLDCYANMLQAEYEYLYSDDAIADSLIAAEYEFTEDGTRA